MNIPNDLNMDSRQIYTLPAISSGHDTGSVEDQLPRGASEATPTLNNRFVSVVIPEEHILLKCNSRFYQLNIPSTKFLNKLDRKCRFRLPECIISALRKDGIFVCTKKDELVRTLVDINPYYSQRVRLDSFNGHKHFFEKCPEIFSNFEALAELGFYATGETDTISHASMGGKLSMWDKDDNVIDAFIDAGQKCLAGNTDYKIFTQWQNIQNQEQIAKPEDLEIANKLPGQNQTPFVSRYTICAPQEFGLTEIYHKYGVAPETLTPEASKEVCEVALIQSISPEIEKYFNDLHPDVSQLEQNGITINEPLKKVLDALASVAKSLKENQQTVSSALESIKNLIKTFNAYYYCGSQQDLKKAKIIEQISNDFFRDKYCIPVGRNAESGFNTGFKPSFLMHKPTVDRLAAGIEKLSNQVYKWQEDIQSLE